MRPRLALLVALVAAPQARAQPSPLPEQPTWAREIAITGLDSAFALAVDAAGRVVVAGSAASNLAFVRLHTDGRIDSTFGTHGIVQLQPDPANRSVVRTLAIESDGRIVAAGTFGSDVGLVRLLANGQRDASFGTNGLYRRDVRGEDRVRTLLPVFDGYLVGGSAEGLTNGGGAPTLGRGAFLAKVTTVGTTASWGQGGAVYPDLRGPSELTTLYSDDGRDVTVGALRKTTADLAAVFFLLDQNGDEQPFSGGGGRVFVSLNAGTDGPLGLVQGLYGGYGAAARNGDDVLVTRFSGSGQNAHTGTFDAGGADVPRGYVGTWDGYTIVAGTSDGQLGFLLSNDPHTVGGIDPSGITVPYQTTARRYAVNGRPTGFEALVLPRGGRRAYVAGWTAGTAGRTSFLVAAFDLPDLVAGEDVAPPDAFTLEVSPVPARRVATVRLSTAARLTLVDALGRTVRTLDVAAGKHPLDVSGLAAGLYVLRADAGEASATHLLPVVR